MISDKCDGFIAGNGRVRSRSSTKDRGKDKRGKAEHGEGRMKYICVPKFMTTKGECVSVVTASEFQNSQQTKAVGVRVRGHTSAHAMDLCDLVVEYPKRYSFSVAARAGPWKLVMEVLFPDHEPHSEEAHNPSETSFFESRKSRKARRDLIFRVSEVPESETTKDKRYSHACKASASV